MEHPAQKPGGKLVISWFRRSLRAGMHGRLARRMADALPVTQADVYQLTAS